jgi:signal transduction histidine kinase
LSEKYKGRISRKIIFSYLVLLVLSILLIVILFSVFSKKILERTLQNQIENNSTLMLTELKKDIDDSSPSERELFILIQQYDRLYLRRYNISMFILTNRQQLYYPLKNNEEITSVLAKYKEILKSSDKEKSNKIMIGEETYLISIRRMQNPVGMSFIFYTPIGNSIDSVLNPLRLPLFYSIILSIIIFIIAGIFIGRSISKPVSALKAYAKAISKKDFDMPLNLKTKNELGDLSESMKNMAKQLKENDITQKRFFQNASHELKTPLMSIQGYAEGLKDGVFTLEDNTLDIIIDESKRLTKLVEELIYISKLETVDDFYTLIPESINGIIEKSIEKVQSLAMKNNIKLNRMLYKDTILGIDSDKIIQALINIISNAIRYAESEVNIITKNDGKSLEITITDDGKGLTEKDKANIFNRFYKGNKGNTGLGLAITKIIIEKHNAKIIAGNSISSGAEFKIIFPL